MHDADCPHILISRLSHIGDCIATIPVLTALRERFPKAFIAWVVEPPTDQLLSHHRALDELIVVQRRWLKSAREVLRLKQRLTSLEFDIAIDPQSLTKSSVVSWLSGAKRRLGLARPLGRELAPLLNTELINPTKTHIVERSLELLQPLGIEDPVANFNMPPETTSCEAMFRFVRGSHLGCGFAVINPGAGWSSRRWSANRFGAVARHLGRAHLLPSVVTWAGEEEKKWAEKIVASSGGHSLLAPPTNLCELGSLLNECRLFVGCDSGPMHLAVSVNTDCVILHGTTRPEVSGPYGPRHVAVQRYYQEGTSRQRRRAENAAMQEITINDVCDACDRVLQTTSVDMPSRRLAS